MNRWFIFAGMLFLITSASFALTGNGVQNDPYLIQTLADFDEFADEYNADVFWASGVYVRLTANIDLDGREYDRAVIAPDEYATTTASNFEGTVYSGVFDGAGHTISNLVIKGARNDYVGLFGKVDGATAEIIDLSLEAIDIVGRWYVGGLAAQNSGTVRGCDESGKIDGFEWYGGLIGLNSGTVTDCHTSGGLINVIGKTFGGGLIGQNSGEVSDCSSTGFSNTYGYLTALGGLIGWNVNGAVTRCHSDVSVSGTDAVGGLIGINDNGTISQCYSLAVRVSAFYAGGLIGQNNGGVINECYSVGEVGGGTHVGGLVGHNNGGTLNDCFSVSTVQGGDYYTGGLVGLNYQGYVNNCFNVGSIKGRDRVGGLVGQNSQGSLRYCYTASDVYGRYDVGGLVGYDGGGCSYVADFWDSTVNGLLTGIGTSADPSGVVGTATSNLSRSGIYAAAGWDFVNKWWIRDDVDTPQLRWRKTSTKTPRIVLFDGQVYGSDSFALHLDPSEGSTWTIQENCDWLEVTPASGMAGASAGITVSTTVPLPAGGYHECQLEVSSDGAGSEVEYVTVVLHVMYGGDGSAGDPFRIGTAEELELMSRRPMDWDKHFIMTADIDVAGRYYYESLIAGVDFNYDGLTFTGSFDGSGHTISSLSCNTYGGHYVGLFGYVGSGAVISNLGLIDAEIIGGKYVGALAGKNQGTVINCYSDGSIRYIGSTRGEYIGGLCGWNDQGTIMQSYSTVDIYCRYSAMQVGGLCGTNGYWETGPGNIYGCYATGSIEVGDGSSTVGGLCGGNATSSAIIGCYATGSVKGGKDSNGLGGLCGDAGSSIIRNCYAWGSVEAGDDSSGVGGLCAYTDSGTIANCYSTGSVKVGEDSVFVGGLIGSGSAVSQSFWDIETCDPNHNNFLGTPKTTDEMQTLSTFVLAGWDFSDDDGDAAIWEMPVVKGYPLLIWGVIGLELEVVPDLFNIPQADAEDAIVASGFSVGSVSSANSSIVPAGRVMGQSPSAGGLVLYGSVIDLVISAGPQIVSAPDLTGMTEAEASDILTSLGLVLGIVASEYHPTAPVGTVFTQEAGPGTKLAVGSPVDIIVSLGWIVLEGQGTEDDPYLISSAVELQIFADEWSAPQYWAADVYTSLGTDLDLSGVNISMIGYPVDFNGVFDGRDHVITNYRDTDHSLFNLGPDGVLMNVRLEDIEIISSAGFVGGIAASNQGLIRNCCVSGTIRSGVNSSYTGGISATNPGGTIEDCYWTGDIVGGYEVGGIVGDNGWYEIRPGQWSSGTVRNCAALGSVSGTSTVGGLVGRNVTMVTMCYSQADVTGDFRVGGLVGGIDFYGKVYDSYAIGKVTGNDKVGGLIGEISSSYPYITEPSVKVSYSAGEVSGTTNVGGLIGYNGYGAIDDCFWDVETSKQTTSGNGGGIGKTTQQMNDPDTFTDAGWDFRKPVWMFSTAPYPRLIWRYPDIDESGIVDLADYAELVKSWMQIDCGICNDSDLTGDLIIDGYDLQILTDNWLDGVSISDQVWAIEFQEGLNYRFPDDDSDTVYTLEIQVHTDQKVEKIEFLAPSGNLFEIPKEASVETLLPEGIIETQWEYDDEASMDTGQETYVWFYEGFFNNSDSLNDYGDGWYTFTVYYSNGRTQQTEVFFGDSVTGQPLPQPTQEPTPQNPVHGGNVTSPVTFSWDNCVDPNASVIHMYTENEVLDEEIETDGLLPKDATSWGPLYLNEGFWNAGIAFAVLDSTINADGVEVTSIKYSNVDFEFTVMP